MTYLLAALFFTLALLGSAVALHMIVLQSWDEIVLALRGELGVRRPARGSRVPAAPARRRVAF